MAGDLRKLALRHYRRQQRITRLTANQVQELWQLLNVSDLTGSWNAGVGSGMVRSVTAGQLASAQLADDYVDEVVDAEGADPERAGTVRPSAFAGLAADGRSLDSLMYLSVITTKQGIGGGLSTQDAMMRGLRQALMFSGSEVTQAGRGAVGTSMVGKRTIQGYVRVVNPPACARCIILAGKEYGWNKGFQRHPRCDCIHLPTTLIARHQYRAEYGRADNGAFVNPRSYFSSLSRAEQDRIFTQAGAQAIRDGGDMFAIVNARRGMYTALDQGRRVRATREGVTRFGAYYRRERARQSQITGIRYARDRIEVEQGLPAFKLSGPRLLPEEIYQMASSREEAIQLLRQYDYLT